MSKSLLLRKEARARRCRCTASPLHLTLTWSGLPETERGRKPGCAGPASAPSGVGWNYTRGCCGPEPEPARRQSRAKRAHGGREAGRYVAPIACSLPFMTIPVRIIKSQSCFQREESMLVGLFFPLCHEENSTDELRNLSVWVNASNSYPVKLSPALMNRAVAVEP